MNYPVLSWREEGMWVLDLTVRAGRIRHRQDERRRCVPLRCIALRHTRERCAHLSQN